MSTVYDKSFYEDQQDGSYRSARIIIPILQKFVNPQSVLDLGCGMGTWLHVFKNNFGISNILGVDGDYVDRKMLRIEESEFLSYNLTEKFSASKKYDLAISLEVAEHLPDSAADNFVSSLTEASDIIAFSAALPGQIGTYHINEQYPEYWAKKFAAQGYIAIDIRKEFWNNREIEWWYRQNIILYIKADAYNNYRTPLLDQYRQTTDPEFLSRIHPEMLDYFQKKFFTLQTVDGFVRHKLYPVKKWFSK